MSDILELEMCGVYLIYAFLAAAIYDLAHTWLLWQKSGRIKHILADTIIIGLLGLILAVLVILQGGIIRWYVWAMVVLGALIYHLTVKKLLRKFYLWLFKQLAKLWQILTFPFRKIAGNIKKYYQKVKKSCEKNDNCTGNMPLDDI